MGNFWTLFVLSLTHYGDIHVTVAQESLYLYHKVIHKSLYLTKILTPLSWCAKRHLTHWGRVTHICVGNLTIIGPDNSLSPSRRQAIIQNNAGILLIVPWGTNFSEILLGIQTFSFKKMHLEMSFAKWRTFCLGLNVLKHLGGIFHSYMHTHTTYIYTNVYIFDSDLVPSNTSLVTRMFARSYIQTRVESPVTKGY